LRPALLRCFARKEKTLPTRSGEAQPSEARARADASFKKEERAKDGAKAMMEYVANNKMVREKTERLKALRLAKEAADKKLEVTGKAAGKR
jgi:hypothetical protein